VARIGTNPAKAHSVASGLLNDFQGQLAFGLKDPFALRDSRFVASLHVVGPFFGHWADRDGYQWQWQNVPLPKLRTPPPAHYRPCLTVPGIDDSHLQTSCLDLQTHFRR